MLENDPWRAVDWTIPKRKQTTGFNQCPLPGDSLLKPRFELPAPLLEAVVRAFTRAALGAGGRAKSRFLFIRTHNPRD